MAPKSKSSSGSSQTAASKRPSPGDDEPHSAAHSRSRSPEQPPQNKKPKQAVNQKAFDGGLDWAEFVKSAKPFTLTLTRPAIGDEGEPTEEATEVTLKPKKMSTGSFGWSGSRMLKLAVTSSLAGAKDGAFDLLCSSNFNITVQRSAASSAFDRELFEAEVGRAEQEEEEEADPTEQAAQAAADDEDEPGTDGEESPSAKPVTKKAVAKRAKRDPVSEDEDDEAGSDGASDDIDLEVLTEPKGRGAKARAKAQTSATSGHKVKAKPKSKAKASPARGSKPSEVKAGSSKAKSKTTSTGKEKTPPSKKVKTAGRR